MSMTIPLWALVGALGSGAAAYYASAVNRVPPPQEMPAWVKDALAMQHADTLRMNEMLADLARSAVEAQAIQARQASELRRIGAGIDTLVGELNARQAASARLARQADAVISTLRKH